MAWEEITTEVTQKKVTFSSKTRNDLEILLTADFIGNWILTASDDEEDLTVQELIDVCEALYSQHIIEGSDDIKVFLRDEEEALYIIGQANIQTTILNGVNVVLSNKME